MAEGADVDADVTTPSNGVEKSAAFAGVMGKAKAEAISAVCIARLDQDDKRGGRTDMDNP